jgi:hypothetical protein
MRPDDREPGRSRRLAHTVAMPRAVDLFFRVGFPACVAVAFVVVAVFGFRRSVWEGLMPLALAVPNVAIFAVRVYRMFR